MPVPLQVGADLAKTSARNRVGVHTSVHYDSITDNDNDYKTDRNKKRKTNHYTQNHGYTVIILIMPDVPAFCSLPACIVGLLRWDKAFGWIFS